MRKIPVYMLTLISISSFAQSAVQYVDAKTKAPVCGIYANIFKNENTFQHCGGSDEEGYFSLIIEDIDTSATYQFSFNHPAYQPVWKEIDIHSTDTFIVELTPDSYHMENTEEVYAQGCNTISLFNYYPREPRSLSELPKGIAEKVTRHLMARVGESSFRTLPLQAGK